MAKKEGQRLKMLYYRDILERYTDEAHSLTRRELSRMLMNKMGIEAEPDRKSIKSDIDVLKDYFSMEELGQLNVIRNPDNKNDVQFAFSCSCHLKRCMELQGTC